VTEPAISIEHLSKRFRLYHDRNQSLKAAVMRGRRAKYEEFWALRDVSLEIAEGLTYGFIGTNGSGKSTLLKCLARILEPDEGSTRTRGKVSALLELGAGFHPELSGRENVYLNGSILGLSKAELDLRFDDIVEFAGLERFIDTPVKNYSSGMYVRLGFSVAINVDPDILLVDEVLAVGDEEFQRRCNERFADLRAEGRTIVVVSHSLGSVQAICDEVAWLDDGLLRATGAAGDVIDQYLTEVHHVRGEGEHHATTGRWGTREVSLDEMEVLAADGMPAAMVRTGQPITFRFHYTAESPVDRPVFTLTIEALDGTVITTPSTRDAGLVPDHLEGRGHLDLVVDPFALLPGTYDLSGAVTDEAGLHVYDHRHRVLRFDVEAGSPRESGGGLMTLNGRWELAQGAASTRRLSP
jgi:ABC-type polysaccharide/polyol phosphate transport system ATPase subunit